MIGFLLLALTFGALIAIIWGKEAAQNCIGALGMAVVVGIALIIDIVACIVWPQFRVVAISIGGIFAASMFYICYNFVTESRDTARQNQERERHLASQTNQREQITHNLLQQIKQALDNADEPQCRLLGEQLQREGLLFKTFPLLEVAANDVDATKRLCAIRVLHYPELSRMLGSDYFHDPVYGQHASLLLGPIPFK